MPHQPPSPAMADCITECLGCNETCLEMLDHCLQLGGDHAEPDHIRLLMDCAEICATSAGFMIRGSSLHAEICRASAEICERCAEDCERFEDDEEMQRCAEVCRACAASCREMARGAAVAA